MTIERFVNIEKPLCVFGVVDNERGREIAKEMLQWLIPNYNLHVVLHDGTEFEFPALHYMQSLCAQLNQPCLYIHSRGAFNKWKTTVPTRKMWKHEFVDLQENYFRLVDTEEPTAACPFTGSGKHTFYNGFVVNAAAMATIPELKPSEDRMVYECIFGGSDVKVYGTILNNVERGNLSDARQYLYRNYLL